MDSSSCAHQMGERLQAKPLTMWSRCWWATWVSGFFGIFGLLHLVRLFIPFRLVVGSYEVPLRVTVAAGLLFLAISGGFLLIEVQRERAKHSSMTR